MSILIIRTPFVDWFRLTYLFVASFFIFLIFFIFAPLIRATSEVRLEKDKRTHIRIRTAIDGYRKKIYVGT